MIVTLHTHGLPTLAQVRAFVSDNEPISFTLEDRHAAYGRMADTLKQFGYVRCKRSDKGVLRQYPRKVTGLSGAQVARCIKQFSAGGGRIKDRHHAPAAPLVRRCTTEDIRLLAEVDALHGTLSGSTTRKLCERAFKVQATPTLVKDCRASARRLLRVQDATERSGLTSDNP